MLRRLVAASAALVMVAGAAYAAPQKGKAAPKPASKKPAPTVVKVCPITSESVRGEGGGSYLVGKYKVYLCCAGCKPDWDKLTAKEKQQKVAAAYTKQKAGTGIKSPAECPREKHNAKNPKKPAGEEKPADKTEAQDEAKP